jgi:trimeric autotransporter adhesin
MAGSRRCKASRRLKTEIRVKTIAALVLISVIIGLGICGCGGGGSTASTSGPNTTLTPTSNLATIIIVPNSSVAGGAAFTLTIDGHEFTAASTVNFGGTAAPTTFVNSSRLTAAIPAAAVATVGTAAVTVTNLAPVGGISDSVTFTITSGQNPIPTINVLSPNCTPIDGPALTLYVGGSNFVASSVVQWNGSAQPTIISEAGYLEAQIDASDIAAGGTPTVTVFNAAPGGGTSNTATFTIGAGVPQSIAVDPSGKFAYVANGCLSNFPGSVSMYTINATTGVLTLTGKVAAGISTTEYYII